MRATETGATPRNFPADLAYVCIAGRNAATGNRTPDMTRDDLLPLYVLPAAAAILAVVEKLLGALL